MTRPRRMPVSSGLTVRLLVMLSLALVPLGSFAVWQNNRTQSEVRRSQETAVLSTTYASVAGELALIRGALGSADALGSAAAKDIGDPEACAEGLRDFVDRSGLFRFAGFAGPSGDFVCGSQEPPWSLGQIEMFGALQEGERPMIALGPTSDPDRRAPLVIASPVKDDGDLTGYMVFILTGFALDFVRDYGAGLAPTNTIIFTGDGRRIGVQPRGLDLAKVLPEGRDLVSFSDGARQVVQARNAEGAPRTYATMPLIDEQLFVLGVWAPDDLPVNDTPLASSSLLFALMVWLASLGVAYLGAHRLVIRHLRKLGRQMRQFSDGNREQLPKVLKNAPDEISELSRDLRHLAETLSRDEVQLESALGEKTLLLREVHHRVRNNLQLIASIISIQIREVASDEARGLLRGLHDRIMTLATVHQSLYKLDRVTELRADVLLGDVLHKMSSISILPGSDTKVTIDLQPVTLEPDQIVPLALLATEAMTNALKYVGPPDEGPARIDVRLHETEAEAVCFEVINTCGAGSETPGRKGGQIGLQLIHAFGAQLEAEAEQGRIESPSGPSFRVALHFPITRCGSTTETSAA